MSSSAPRCAGARTIGSTVGWRVPIAAARKSAAVSPQVIARDAPVPRSAPTATARGDLPHMRLAQAAYLINGGPFVRTETSAVQRLRWH